MAFQPLEKLHRLHDGFIQAYRLGQLDILLVQHQGTLYGYKNYCPHQGAPLTFGTIEQGAIRCPLHGLMYNLKDGQPVNGNTGPLEAVNLVYEGNQVGIDV